MKILIKTAAKKRVAAHTAKPRASSSSSNAENKVENACIKCVRGSRSSYIRILIAFIQINKYIYTYAYSPIYTFIYSCEIVGQSIPSLPAHTCKDDIKAAYAEFWRAGGEWGERGTQSGNDAITALLISTHFDERAGWGA